jgi:predicted ABC-type ATPase
MVAKPQLVIIGGPNGAGKPTFARTLIAAMGVQEFVNADVIARGLSAMHPETTALESARIMRERLEKLASSRKDFAFETTLAARTYAPWICGLCRQGWTFRLIFVALQSPDLAVERVKCRVAEGGHNVPEDDIRRRFVRGIRNFHRLYIPLADTWIVYDNTSPDPRPHPIAAGERGKPPDIIEVDLWQHFCEFDNADR